MRLQRAVELLLEFLRPLYIPKQYLPDYGLPIGNKSKKEAVEVFKTWLKDLPNIYIVVYIDGSKSTTRAVG